MSAGTVEVRRGGVDDVDDERGPALVAGVVGGGALHDGVTERELVPDAGVQVPTRVPDTRIRGGGSRKVTLAPSAEVASTVTSAGCSKSGAVSSWTFTWNEVEAEFAEPSVAVQVTVVAPRANVVPEAGRT